MLGDMRIPEEQSSYVYIVQCENGLLYVGMSRDVQRRFKQHLHSPKGAKFTKDYAARKVVYQEGPMTLGGSGKLRNGHTLRNWRWYIRIWTGCGS